MTMEEYERKFMKILRHMDFIKDEKVKIYMLLSGIPSFYKDTIQFYETKTLEEEIGKDKYFYEKNNGRLDFQKARDDNKKKKMD